MRRYLSIFLVILGLFLFGQNVKAADWQTLTLDDSGQVGYSVSVIADSNDKIHIAYFDYDNTALKYITDESGAWVSQIIDNEANVGYGVSIKVDSSNKSHISYIDKTNKNLKYATNSSGVWMISTIDNSGTIDAGPGFIFGVTNNTSIGIDASNKVHISYHDTTNSDLKYATNKTGSWVITVIDSSNDVGDYNSLGIDTNGYVHISYFDDTNNYLKYVTNSLAGAWATSVLDNSANSGSFTSLDLDSDNKVHISYSSSANYVLSYIANVSGSWVKTIVDSDQSSGYNTSIMVDSDNNVRISYSNLSDDAMTSELRYATNFSGQWTIISLDSDGPIWLSGLSGYYNPISIIADSDNRSYVVYYNINNHDLRMVFTPGVSVSSYSINDGRDYSAYRNIDVGSSVSGTPTEMIVSTKSDFSDASWITYSANTTFKMPSKKGEKTIYVKFRDVWHVESDVVSFEVKYVGNPKFVTKKATGNDEVMIKEKNKKYYARDFNLNFKKYPNKFKNTKRYLTVERHKKYPKTFADAKNNLLKKYWKMMTDFTKYKSDKPVKIKIIFQYTADEFKVLKKKVKGLKEKNLHLKFYDPNVGEWRDVQVKPDTTNNKFVIYLNSLFNYPTFYYAIGR